MADEAKIKIDGVEYPMPGSYKLGEARVYKRLTGRTLDEFESLSFADPDLIVFLVWVAMHRADPKVTVEMVEAFDFEQIDWTGGEEEETELPPDSALSSSNAELPDIDVNGGSASEALSLETIRGHSGTPH